MHTVKMPSAVAMVPEGLNGPEVLDGFLVSGLRMMKAIVESPRAYPRR
ncbi:hypothetical protein [Paracidovorax anthurii]|nr:hypothetical protein [Paracidovorax anthurii]